MAHGKCPGNSSYYHQLTSWASNQNFMLGPLFLVIWERWRSLGEGIPISGRDEGACTMRPLGSNCMPVPSLSFVTSWGQGAQSHRNPPPPSIHRHNEPLGVRWDRNTRPIDQLLWHCSACLPAGEFDKRNKLTSIKKVALTWRWTESIIELGYFFPLSLLTGFTQILFVRQWCS